MKLLLKYGAFIFTLMFIFAVAYRNERYNAFVQEADLAFSQSDSAFVNSWYASTQQEQDIIEQNRQANQTTLVENDVRIVTENESSTNNLDNLTIPTFTSGVQAYMFAEQVLSMANGLEISISGIADAGITKQAISSVRKRDNNGNVYMLAVSYSSFMKTGMEAYNNQRMFKIRTTSAVTSDLRAKFNDASWAYTSVAGFSADFGNMPDQLNYIVNASTVLEESNFKFENGLYTFTLDLNPTTSTARYKYNIRKNAGASDFPNFSSVKLTVTIDQNARFKSITYQENYSINVGITAKTKTNYTETFNVIHGPVTINTPSGF